MPICSRHPDKPMIRVDMGVETVGSGWDAHQAYFEDYLCEECGFRVRAHYAIINIGKGGGSDGRAANTSNNKGV